MLNSYSPKPSPFIIIISFRPAAKRGTSFYAYISQLKKNTLMMTKVIYAVALTACVTVACQEQQIAPSHPAGGNSIGIGSSAAVRAHLKKLDRSLVAYYP